MDRVSRRSLLRTGLGAAAAGAAIGAGPFQGFVALAEGATRRGPDFRNLRAIPDLRDGKVRLHLPEGFQYRSFHDTEFPVVARRRHRAPGPPRRHGRVPRPQRQRDPRPQPRDQQPRRRPSDRARRTTPAPEAARPPSR